MPESAQGPRSASQELGELGERIAERWLRRAGWSILARRWRSGHRDVDLIAQSGSTVAFVEVKARSGLGFGDPATAVHWRKRRELTRSALSWIDRHGADGQSYRFDVFAVLVNGPNVRIRHLENAFPMHDPRA
ncbi:MAG TPA: YraN family protein [Gemmatimonadales bacterium]|nr:YraN family protein [Gemmatimonadales bacterium]